MPLPLSRRHFLQGAAALTFWPGRSSGADPAPARTDRLRVAMIGTAGQAGSDLRAIAAAGAEIVALCDVDEKRAGPAREMFPKAAFEVDFRRLFDRKDLDAVAIGTPDHTHAIPAILALQAGKHVFCEKPLTHNVAEARAVTELAARTHRVTQMGTQIHAGENYRRVVEVIRAGTLGPIHAVHVWVGKAWSGGVLPQDHPPVPEGLHYDLWLGPAAERPYSPAFVPARWRGWWDFGGGTLADMGCHYYDLVQWALGLQAPARIEAEGPPVDAHSAPPWLIARYHYAARENQPPLQVTWHSGRRPKEHAELFKTTPWGDGVLFQGEKGMLLADYSKYKLLPEERFAQFQPPAPSIPRSIGHYKEWVEACKTGAATTCHFGYAGVLTETILLGNVAYRAGRPIEWDARRMKIPNAPEAERFLRREARAPWRQILESV